MKKNTGKVLSLVLAMAMAVSTFTATFASAATLEVEGTGARVDAIDGKSDTSYDLVSDKDEDLLIIEDLDAAFDVQTMNWESADEIEYVGFTKVSGDSLVKVVRNDDQRDLYLKKGVSGTETIRVTMKATYVDEDTDKDVTVRGTIDIDFTVYTQGDVVIGQATENGEVTGAHPDDPELAAVNDSGMDLMLYVANYTGNGTPEWKAVSPYTGNGEAVYTGSSASEDGILKLSSTKIFNMVTADAEDNNVAGSNVVVGFDEDSNAIYLPLIRTDKDSGRVYAKPATTTLELYAPKVTVNSGNTVTTDETSKGSRIRVTIGVGKIWQVGNDLDRTGEGNWTTIAKIGSRTVIGSSPSSDDSWSEEKGYVKVISNYDIRTDVALTIESGNLGDITGAGSVTVNGGNIDSIDVDGDVNISEATVGDVDGAKISVDTGATVASIDGTDITIQGAAVTGAVNGTNVEITGDADYKTTIGGDVSADNDLKVNAYDDEVVSVSGKLVSDSEDTAMTITGLGVSIAGIDTDFRDTEILFDEYKGSLEIISTDNAHAVVSLESGADVTVTNDTYLGVVSVDEESTLTFLGTIKLEDLSGDGVVKVNANSMYVTSGIDGIQFQLLGNPTVGDVALRATVDTVAPEDINGIGFTTEQVAENSTTDKFVIDAVSFAGLSFDKSAVEIAKGYSDTVTLNVYPAGTTLPKDVYVSWNLEGDEDYIDFELDATGTVATIKVLDYNPDYSYSNKATLTATLVDADGFEIEDYVVASCEITGKAVPDTTVTLDTTTVTKSVGQIYQFIAKSSDNSAITAASSDESVATVALYDANDARGYKFQINAVGIGTATITATNATGATATMTVNVVENKGSLKIDTTSYTMAPGGIYDVKVTVDGVDAEPVVTISRDAIASLTSLGEGKYRITARNEGVTYVMAKVTVNGVEYGASVKVEVANGATASGVTGNNVTYFA